VPPQSEVISSPVIADRIEPAPDTPRVVIRASGLGKCFKIYPRPSGRFVEWLSGGRAVRHQDFWALRDVSLTIRKGESLGVIGVNGSGKSTLLKILSGAMYPSHGSFEVDGAVLSLLELGTGLNVDLTGRENVANSARLLGFPPGHVEARLPQIEAFADLGEFFDKPVRLYSSGMVVRLAFGMFASLDPDVFIVDEALSVGDVFFQQKCVRRLEAMREAGTTMLFVSHDMQLVRRLCRRAVLMSHGRVEFEGEPDECIARYYSAVGAAQRGELTARDAANQRDAIRLSPSTPSPGTPGEGRGEGPLPITNWKAATGNHADLLSHDILRRARSRHGSRALELVAATFQDESGRHALSLRQGEIATVRLLLRAREPVPTPSAGIHLFDRLGNLVFAAGTAQLRKPLPDMDEGDERVVTFRITFSVQPGEYVFSLGCSVQPEQGPPDVSPLEDQHEGLGPLTVYPPPEGQPYFYGIARLPMEVSF
jgi:ABC-type polysaccharide/polyol phosphate transport system ATPase subunit